MTPFLFTLALLIPLITESPLFLGDPFILNDKGVYYLVYSGNGYESQDYGQGFAVSKSLRGPWIKHPENPFFQRPGNLVGVGHCSFFYDQEEQLKIVYHSHEV